MAGDKYGKHSVASTPSVANMTGMERMVTVDNTGSLGG